MNIKLVVKHAFKDYAIGDEITGEDEIASAKASHPGHVLQVDAEPAETPWISHEPPAEASAKTPPPPPPPPSPPPPPAANLGKS